MKILIIEDEKELAEGIKGILSKSGYESDAVYDGDTGLEYMLDRRYDLILLDLMLPGMDGLEILKTARMEGFSAPVIILTAKSQIEDKITGLDNGADDYLVKPFDAGELLARIRARTRNSLGGTGSVLAAFDIQIDRTTYRLIRGERSIKLSNKEFQMMEYFIVNKGIILTRDKLISNVWGYDEEVEYNSVDVYVSFLRKKLLFVKAMTTIITKKGVGYSLEGINND